MKFYKRDYTPISSNELLPKSRDMLVRLVRFFREDNRDYAPMLPMEFIDNILLRFLRGDKRHYAPLFRIKLL